MKIKGSSTWHCRRCTKEPAKENGDLERARVGARKAARVAKVEEKAIGKRAVERKEARDKKKGEKERQERAGHVERHDTLQPSAGKEATGTCMLWTKMKMGMSKRWQRRKEDLQAWCLLEESENEQWQEVISKRNKQKTRKTNKMSLLSVENSQSLQPKKVVEMKDKWVKVRATMDTGAAGHVMPETMFPHVKLERRTSPKKFVAANGDQIKDLGEKSIPFKTKEGIQRCITFRSANVVKPLISMQKVVRAGNVVVLDDRNPHIRSNRDGAIIKLDVNNGVYTMDMWICLDETGPVFSWQGQ